MKKLLIMAAGTGGHIFPGLAIARTMQERGWQVTWLGTEHGMERDIVPRQQIEMDSIDFRGLRGKGLRHSVTGAFKMVAGFAACVRLMGRREPDVVLGMGGYVTVPGGIAAKMRGIPLVLMNADAALLLSNKVLAPAAQKVCFGFGGDIGAVPGKAVITGNPVRQEIINVPPPGERYAMRSGPLRILVIGGSLGAKVLNDTLPQALARIPAEQRPVVTHQSGKQHIEVLRAAYAEAGVDAEMVDFIEDMPRRYADADLVICRAGAITVAELTAAGVASILVPLVVSTTSHQRDNARWMASRNAAIHLPQVEMTAVRLAEIVQRLSRDDCLEMARSAYEQGRRDANTAIAGILEEAAGAA